MPRNRAKERAAQKEWAREQDEHRQWIEAEIAELEKKGLSTEQICNELGLLTLEQLRDKYGLEHSRAKQFIFDRLKGVKDVNNNVWDAIHRAMVDLLLSDIPLDRYSRDSIAESLRRLAFPDPKAEREMKKQVFARAVADQKRYLESRGMTAAEAEKLIAEQFGLTVETLRQRIQRTRKK